MNDVAELAAKGFIFYLVYRAWMFMWATILSIFLVCLYVGIMASVFGTIFGLI